MPPHPQGSPSTEGATTPGRAVTYPRSRKSVYSRQPGGRNSPSDNNSGSSPTGEESSGPAAVSSAAGGQGVMRAVASGAAPAASVSTTTTHRGNLSISVIDPSASPNKVQQQQEQQSTGSGVASSSSSSSSSASPLTSSSSSSTATAAATTTTISEAQVQAVAAAPVTTALPATAAGNEVPVTGTVAAALDASSSSSSATVPVVVMPSAMPAQFTIPVVPTAKQSTFIAKFPARPSVASEDGAAAGAVGGRPAAMSSCSSEGGDTDPTPLSPGKRARGSETRTDCFCAVCGDFFTRPSNLKRHYQSNRHQENLAKMREEGTVVANAPPLAIMPMVTPKSQQRRTSYPSMPTAEAAAAVLQTSGFSTGGSAPRGRPSKVLIIDSNRNASGSNNSAVATNNNNSNNSNININIKGGGGGGGVNAAAAFHPHHMQRFPHQFPNHIAGAGVAGVGGAVAVPDSPSAVLAAAMPSLSLGPLGGHGGDHGDDEDSVTTFAGRDTDFFGHVRRVGATGLGLADAVTASSSTAMNDDDVGGDEDVGGPRRRELLAAVAPRAPGNHGLHDRSGPLPVGIPSSTMLGSSHSAFGAEWVLHGGRPRGANDHFATAGEEGGGSGTAIATHHHHHHHLHHHGVGGAGVGGGSDRIAGGSSGGMTSAHDFLGLHGGDASSTAAAAGGASSSSVAVAGSFDLGSRIASPRSLSPLHFGPGVLAMAPPSPIHFGIDAAMGDPATDTGEWLRFFEPSTDVGGSGADADGDKPSGVPGVGQGTTDGGIGGGVDVLAVVGTDGAHPCGESSPSTEENRTASSSPDSRMDSGEVPKTPMSRAVPGPADAMSPPATIRGRLGKAATRGKRATATTTTTTAGTNAAMNEESGDQWTIKRVADKDALAQLAAADGTSTAAEQAQG